MAPKSTGVLFSLKGAEFARTYSQLVKISEKLDIDRRGLAYWAPGKAGGRFTPLVANAAVKFIQKVIREGDSEITSGFKPLNKNYQKWKTSFGANNHWFRTGSMAESITYRVSTFSSKAEMGILTIDPTARISRDAFGKSGGDVAATSLFHWLEFGTEKMEARPLVGLSIRKFSSLYFPQIVDSVNLAFSKWVKKIHTNNSYWKKSVNVTSLETLVTRDVNKDFEPSPDNTSVPEIEASVDSVKNFLKSKGFFD